MPQEPGRGGHKSSPSPHGEHGPGHALLWGCDRINFCCFKAARFWYFVTAALRNSHTEIQRRLTRAAARKVQPERISQRVWVKC